MSSAGSSPAVPITRKALATPSGGRPTTRLIGSWYTAVTPTLMRKTTQPNQLGGGFCRPEATPTATVPTAITRSTTDMTSWLVPPRPVRDWSLTPMP